MKGFSIRVSLVAFLFGLFLSTSALTSASPNVVTSITRGERGETVKQEKGNLVRTKRARKVIQSKNLAVSSRKMGKNVSDEDFFCPVRCGDGTCSNKSEYCSVENISAVKLAQAKDRSTISSGKK